MIFNSILFWLAAYELFSRDLVGDTIDEYI